MDLGSLIVPSKTIEIEVPGFTDFIVKLSYLTRDELVALRKKCTSVKFERREATESVDNDLFQRLYIKEVIKGWTGLKYKYLLKLVPVDLSAIDDYENKELDYSESNAELIMRNSNTFDTWVTHTLDDVENFTKTS